MSSLGDTARGFGEWFRVDKLATIVSERRRWIEIASLLYLFLPYLIFFLSWLKPWVAILAVVASIWAIRNYLLTSSPLPRISLPKNHRMLVFATIAVLLLLWSFFSGVGGFTAQSGDYLKHNAIFHDLINFQWPVVYGNGNSLSYYVGYYLPSAAFAKLTTPAMADYFQLFWMILGIFIAFYWVCRLTGTARIWLAVLFIGFSGMDILGYIIFHHSLPSLGYLALEWSTSPDVGYWQYSANSTLLDWTPQHAIAGWIVVAMIISEYVEKKPKKNTFFLYSLIWLTSPMIATWLGVFIAGIFIASIKKWRSFFSFQNIAFPLLMLIIIGSYFATNMYHQPYGFIWDFMNFKENIPKLLLFHLFEYGIYALLIFPYVRKEQKEWKVLFTIAMIMLAVMPLFMYGLYNDQLMRGSIPALFILMILIARMLSNTAYKVNRILLTICLIIGGAVPAYEIWNHLEIGKPKYNDWVSIENTAMDPGTRNLANQYYGNRDTFFYKFLAQ